MLPALAARLHAASHSLPAVVQLVRSDLAARESDLSRRSDLTRTMDRAEVGGETMAGKKTGLAVVAYAVLSILQAVGVAGTATGPTSTTTGQILTTLIAAFGGLGLTAKIDRVVQTLGLIAAKPPSQ